MNLEFIKRLHTAFNNASMADVARRLKMPHATVRNYYQGRLPAPEVLIKIAKETGVSLNWLLIGTGNMYAGETAPIGLGRFLEEKINEIIDHRLAAKAAGDIQDLGAVDQAAAFDVQAALLRADDPEGGMSGGFRHEGRKYPKD